MMITERIKEDDDSKQEDNDSNRDNKDDKIVRL